MNNKINSSPDAGRRYRHLFFDLDHTLWDFDTNAKEALMDVYTFFKLEEKDVHPFDDFYTIYLKHNATLWDRYHKGFITSEDLKWKRMWRTLLDFKIGNEFLAKDISAKFLDILPTKKALFVYTIEILEYLAAKNYSLHLITNGFEKTQHSKIKNASLSKYFTEVITSERSSAVKPSREIFDYAIKVTGADVRESIMIGDNPDADIQGAINAGMDSIFVNHAGIGIDLHPTHTVYSLKELEDIL